ncbi:MAG: hypothetical protein HYY38_01710 [Rhodospirillales bacterium]|nr:hypothetical protein [Rhodospirillales bacterium]
MAASAKPPDSPIVAVKQISEASDDDLKAWDIDPLLDYWNKVRGDAFAPRWEDFHIIDLPADVRGGLVVVDHDPGRNDFRVRFWGVDLWDMFGVDLTGAWLSDIKHMGVLHHAETATGETKIYPVIRLPISDDGTTVTKIITVRNAKRLGWRR